MGLKKIAANILQWSFTRYLSLIDRTVRIIWDEENIYGDSQIFGFWHEDSFFMNVENMVRRCGGSALRVPDGYKAFATLKKIVQDSYEKTHSVAVALDGPLGPRHEPKKLAFYLSEHAEEEFVGISLSYSSCLRLTRRWDKYVIPLPFTTVAVAVKNYGIVKKNAVPALPVSAQAPDRGGACKQSEESLKGVL